MKIWTSVLVAALGTAAMAQTSIYAPARSIKDQNISLRGWGSGTISETDETAFEGAFSLRVSTRNFFQGGMIAFGNPLDWGKAYDDPSNLVRLTFRVADTKMTLGGTTGGGGDQGGGGAGLAGGGDQGGGRGGARGGGAGGFKAGGAQGGGAGGGDLSGTTATTFTLKRIRMIVTTTDGKKSEAYVNVSTGGANSKGWRSIAVPVKAINGFDKTNKLVKELAFSGDTTSTFYIGDMRVVTDTTPITGEIKTGNLNLALRDEVELRGTGAGGSSILKFTWDFDAKDGIQEDAEGAVVKRKFRVPGTYTVTLTISDAYGLKKSYSTTIQVKVNP